MAESFNCLVGEKDSLCIVVFAGKMTTEQIPELAKLEADLAKKEILGVIFHCKDLVNVQIGCHQALASLQKVLRDVFLRFAFSSLDSEIKKTLIAAGIIRAAEALDSLPAAKEYIVNGL